jgi:hypothetical protein
MLACPRQSGGKAISAVFINSYFFTMKKISGRQVNLFNKKKKDIQKRIPCYSRVICIFVD